MILLMILNLSNLSQSPINEQRPKDIIIHGGESDSSSNEEIIVLRLFVAPPQVNLNETLIEPLISKEDSKIMSVNLIEINNDDDTIRKEIEENEILNLKEDEETEQESDSNDDSTPNNKDVRVKPKKTNRNTAMIIGSVFITILISVFCIVSIFYSSTLRKKMVAFVPLCIISIAFGYLAKELLKVVPVLVICLFFIVKCD